MEPPSVLTLTRNTPNAMGLCKTRTGWRRMAADGAYEAGGKMRMEKKLRWKDAEGISFRVEKVGNGGCKMRI